MRLIPCITVAIFVVILGISPFAIAGSSASGDLVMDGNTYKMTSVIAKTDENSFDETKKDIVVLLTDQPVPEERFNLSAIYDMAETAHLHGIMLTINDAKEVYSLVVLGLTQKSGNHICEFQATQFNVSSIAGKVFSAPEEMFGHKYQFNIQFEVPVTDSVAPVLNEETGTPLPAGGGDPGKAYMEYDKIVRAGKVDEMKKFAADEKMAKQLEDPRAKEMIQMLKMMRATQIKVLKGFINGDRATLFVEGKDPMSGSKTEGTVRMVLVNNSWKIQKESWKGSM